MIYFIILLHIYIFVWNDKEILVCYSLYFVESISKLKFCAEYLKQCQIVLEAINKLRILFVDLIFFSSQHPAFDIYIPQKNFLLFFRFHLQVTTFLATAIDSDRHQSIREKKLFIDLLIKNTDIFQTFCGF